MIRPTSFGQGSGRWNYPALSVCLISLLALFATHAVSPVNANPLSLTTSHNSSADQPRTKEDIAKDRDSLVERMRQVQEAITNYQAKHAQGAPPTDLLTELELLKWLDLSLAQSLASRSRDVQLQQEREELMRRNELGDIGLPNSPPYSFLMLDDARDDLIAEQSRQESIRLETESAEAMLRSAQAMLSDSEKQRRAVREELDRAPDGSERARLARHYDLAELKSRAARSSIDQYESAVRALETELAVSELQTQLIQKRVDTLKSSARFSEEELKTRLAVISTAEADLRSRLNQAQSELNEANRRLQEARRQAENAAAGEELSREIVATWKMASEALQEEISAINQLLGEIAVVRVSWKRRYDLANGLASTDDLLEWHHETDGIAERIERLKQLSELRLDELRDDLVTLSKRVRNLDDQPNHPLLPWLRSQSAEVERLVGVYSANLVLIKTGERLLERFAVELDEEITPSSANRWLAISGTLLRGFWDFELTSIDDQPITVSKIVTGFGLLLLWYLLARQMSRVLGNRLLPRFGLNAGASVALQTISFYLMLTVFACITLEVINLPLTVFAFMGGAIAIGVGFGSQNVLNNFISGLIILAERPIRVGDLVDIDGLCGTIEAIGARSTRVKTGSNLEIIVPNSKFLENNVSNWTLSNTQIRTMVTVGVAYGSPTKDVERILRKAVTTHPNVLDDPEPTILFKEFGDNSLNFEVHFWVRMRTVMQGEKVASDVRFAIDDLFRRADITIAFPQRDVHLEASAPIEVHVRDLMDATQRPAFGRKAA